MFGAPYINPVEYERITKMKASAERFNQLRAAAHAGNIQAAYAIGDALIIGAWDVKRMEVDLARGQLLPPTPNPNQDPYLCVPRDQYQAINYLKFCASYPNEDLAVEISLSRAFLAFMRKKMDIQYYGTGKLDSFFDIGFTSITNNATHEERMSNPFMPFAFKRPEVLNPKTRMFTNVATVTKLHAWIMVGLFHCIALMMSMFYLGSGYDSSVRGFVTIHAFVFVAYTIPLLVFVYFCSSYGIGQTLPICSCSKIREARNLALAQLPDDCKVGEEDPFEKTPFIVRNSHSMIQALFGFYFVFAALIAALRMKEIIKEIPFIPSWLLPYFLGISALLPFIAFVLEVNFSSCGFYHSACFAEYEQIVANDN